MEGNRALGKKLDIAAIITSIAVVVLVGVMRVPNMKIDTTIDFSFLPPIHAFFNCVVAIALIFALYFIKRKNVQAHRKMIYVAMSFSFLFLLSYVIYHFTTTETLYSDFDHNSIVTDAEKAQSGSLRTVYFIFLASHILLAAISLPFILFTFIRGFTGQVAKHKRLARFVWPVWFYVAVSGPICYFMLKPFYA
ncbi:MAG: putative membrane protein [Saprospiraceae bacterium]|jgi:putative membrane protein